MSLVNILSQASKLRKFGKAMKKTKKKGLQSGALKKQIAIRRAYAQDNFSSGIQEGLKSKRSFKNIINKSLRSYGSMQKELFKKTPKTQLAIGTVGTASTFAGGYFLNRQDDEE